MAKTKNKDELYADAINGITEKLSHEIIKEYSKLPEELQKGLVLIKSSQLLLANVLCQIAMNREELDELASLQGEEMQNLIMDCAMIGYADKFGIIGH